METMSEQRCRRLAATQENLIRRDQATSCGMSPSAIARRTAEGWWTIVLPRVYSTDHAEITWPRAAHAAALWGGNRSVLSHETAAALWRLEGFPPGPLVVTAEKALRPPRCVRVHKVRELGPADLASHGGLTVTSPARTLLDVAAVAPEGVEAALDDALRMRLVSLPKLRWYLAAHGGRGRRGTALLRQLLDERPADYAPPESPLERRVWDLLIAAGPPEPVRQHEILDQGQLVARVDFAFVEARIAVEADGYRWHSGRQAWSKDLARRNRLTALGWHVLHITHEDVTKRPREVTALVRRTVATRTLSRELRSAKAEPKRTA